MKRLINLICQFIIFFLILNCEKFFLETGMKNVLNDFISYSNSHDFEKASLLFLYDDNLSNEEVKLRKNVIVKKIKKLSNNLGDMYLTNSAPDTIFLEFEITACDSIYLANRPFVKAGVFPIIFDKAGSGWLEIQVVSVESELKIRKLVFEVPRGRHKSEPQIDLSIQVY